MSDTRRFGTFKEQSARYINWPSVHEFVNKDLNATYDMERLVRYMKSAGIVCVTSGINFTHAFTTEKFSGSYAILTDGVWQWPEDLVLYVEKYGVVIPDEWYRYIQSVNFVIPEGVKRRETEVDWDSDI